MTIRLTQPPEEARLIPTVADAAASKEQAMPERVSRNAQAAQLLAAGIAMTAVMGGAACTPTVRIEASDKPITINLNVKIDQEIRYRLDKDLEDAIAANPNLF